MVNVINELKIVKPIGSNASNLLQFLYSHLLDLWFPNLVRHPGRGALGLIHLDPLPREHVPFFVPLSRSLMSV